MQRIDHGQHSAEILVRLIELGAAEDALGQLDVRHELGRAGQDRLEVAELGFSQGVAPTGGGQPPVASLGGGEGGRQRCAAQYGVKEGDVQVVLGDGDASLPQVAREGRQR